jgi:hypothetical protein
MNLRDLRYLVALGNIATSDAQRVRFAARCDKKCARDFAVELFF